MDPRYQWPPQGPPNGQYVPPPPPSQPNSYPLHYEYPQQPMPQHPMPIPQQYAHQQQIPQQPYMGNPPPRPSQQYPVPHNGMGGQQRYAQPQVVIPARNPGMSSSSPLAGMNMTNGNPRIRQVQVSVPAQRPQQSQPQLQRSNSNSSMRDGVRVQVPARQPQQQTPVSKSVQRSQSFQENQPRPQQQSSNLSSNQYRTPLQPHSTPQQRMPSSQHSTPQQRIPSSTSTVRQHSTPGPLNTPSSQNRHPQVVIKKTTPGSASSQSRPAYAPAKALPTDLGVLLLHAADEYINAARSMGSVAAMLQREEDTSEYYKLMATGLGCMGAALKKHSYSPRDQANLMLRYASLLIEETENDIEIEELISKGIALCTRSRLLDLKYSMQHLQARYQFKTNHRAALRSLDGPIAEAETFQHIVWVYAFRFLKVSLAIQASGRHEMASALQQLHAISAHAEKRGDRAIFVTVAALEAMIHLRTAGPDHIEHAQRAIASARSYQLQSSTKEIGQIAALIDSIDIACSLQKGRPDNEKMRALQQKADSDPGPADGVFSVLIEKTFGGQSLTQHTGGIFTKSTDARDELVLSWLPQNQLKMLAYYLSGLTVVSQDSSRGRSYLQEGLNITKDSLTRPTTFPASIPTSINHQSWVMTLDWHLRFTLGLVACRSDDPPSAKDAIASLRLRSAQPLFKDNETLSRLSSYLAGVHAQCTGAHSDALATYASLTLPDAPTRGDLKTDLAILAAMNRILIIRNPTHPSHAQMATLFAALEPLCTGHPNLYIDGAFRIIRVLTTPPHEAIQRQKTLLQVALSNAQGMQNYQFMTICLCYMASRFFSDTVGEQAVKSVRAARSVSKQGKMVVWNAVAMGLCVGTFGRNGLERDAEECGRAVRGLVGQLPGTLVRELQGHTQLGEVQQQGGPLQDGLQDVQMTG